MDFYKILNLTCLAFVIVGGLNWGFVSLLGFDPLAPILGGYDSLLTKIIYGAIGISSLWTFYAYIMTPGYSPGDDEYKKVR